MSEYDEKAPIAEEGISVDKVSNARANLRTAVDVIDDEGIRQRRKEFSRCGGCVFYGKPNHCRVVEGPVQEDQVCDWVQVRGGALEEVAKERLPAQSDIFAEPRPFAWGLMKLQQLLHLRVINYAMTGDAPLLLLEDGQDPPHRFSMSLDRFVDMLALELGWTPEEADELVRLGKSMDYKPPTSYEEAQELYGRGELSTEDFEPFKRAHEAELKAAA